MKFQTDPSEVIHGPPVQNRIQSLEWWNSNSNRSNIIQESLAGNEISNQSIEIAANSTTEVQGSERLPISSLHDHTWSYRRFAVAVILRFSALA